MYLNTLLQFPHPNKYYKLGESWTNIEKVFI